jgi:Ca-activated chloride channel family protein
MMMRMGIPFTLDARAERASVPSGKSSLWAAIRVAAGASPLERERAPLALVLLIDVSGSMKGAAIEHVLKSCEILSELLTDKDRLAIVTFADHAGVRCGLTAMDADGRQTVQAALRDIVADGATNMHAGLEAGAGLLVSMTAPGLRRVMVVMSDGQPNRGLSSADQLSGYIQTLRPLGVSSLGFGLHHDENVLSAVATAGSGRYAYVPDPIGARVELARAALAHGGIVADSLELRVKLAEGVELVRVLPSVKLRHGGSGVSAAIGDVFVDENRIVAVELALDLAAAKGQLAEIEVSGRAPDGAAHVAKAVLKVDVHAGPHAFDRDAQRDVLLVRADAARGEARAHADRGATAAAASLLREMVSEIAASEGFVADDGSALAELREQLLDEIANYEKKGSDEERVHQRKGTMVYSPYVTTAKQAVVSAPGALIDEGGNRHQLFTDTTLGRSTQCELPIVDNSLSRKHARIMFLNGRFELQDLGSTNGCFVNGQAVRARSAALKDGDILQLGFVKFKLHVEK